MATTPGSGGSTHAISVSELAGEVLLAAELAVTSNEELGRLLAENPMLQCSSAMERSLTTHHGGKPLTNGVLEPECLDFIRLVLQAGRPREAKRLCLKALKWQPACSPLWEYQADAEEVLGEHDVAVRLRRAAAHCEPGPTTKRGVKASITSTLYGGALIGRGEFMAARAALDRAYTISKDNEDRELAMGTLEILVHLREAVLSESRKDRGLDRSVMMGSTPEANLLRDVISAGDLAITCAAPY